MKMSVIGGACPAICWAGRGRTVRRSTRRSTQRIYERASDMGRRLMALNLDMNGVRLMLDRRGPPVAR